MFSWLLCYLLLDSERLTQSMVQKRPIGHPSNRTPRTLSQSQSPTHRLCRRTAGAGVFSKSSSKYASLLVLLCRYRCVLYDSQPEISHVRVHVWLAVEVLPVRLSAFVSRACTVLVLAFTRNFGVLWLLLKASLIRSTCRSYLLIGPPLCWNNDRYECPLSLCSYSYVSLL